MLYILHGPDDLTRTEKITELKNALGDPVAAEMNFATLDGRTMSLSDLRQQADSMPFLSPRRLVVMSGYMEFLAPKEEPGDRDMIKAPSPTKSAQWQALAAYLPHFSPTTDLVLVENKLLIATHPLLKLAEKLGGQAQRLAGPDKNNLPSWIMGRAKSRGITIEAGAAQLLGQLVGVEVRTLDSELEKLALYVALARPIQRADVELLVPYTEEAENFGLSNAIGQRNARRAYDQVHKQLEDKHPLVILASITNQIRTLIEVKEMAERGMTPAEIAKTKGWKSDFAATARLKEAANFSMPRLEQTLETLLEIDVSIKTGRIDSFLALDMLIARLSAR